MNTAVVVSSCDPFRDAWAPFFYFFAKEWPDCPWPVYLITNYGNYSDPRVKCLAVGRDRDWANNLIQVLDRIQADQIVYLQEDYFFTRPVRTAQLKEDMDFMRRCAAPYLGLYPSAGPTEKPYEGHARINLLRADAPMRASLQAAVWDVKALQSLLRAGEDAWDMEKLGTERSRKMLFLRVRSREDSPMDYFCTAIKRGAWEPGAVEMCRKNGILLDLNFRPVRPETKGQRFRRKWRFKIEMARQWVYPMRFKIDAIPR